MTSKRSYLSQHAALFILVIILFASLYPFSGWRYTGRPVLEFMTYPLPYYVTFYDNLLNVLAYLPYGFALALSFRPRWLGWLASVLLGGLTSFAVEFTQQFIPTRIADNLDFLFNLAGTTIGATLAISPLFRRIWHRVWNLRRQIFITGSMADYGVLLILIWFVTQFNPSVPLFDVVIRPSGLPQPFVSPLENPALFLLLVEAGAAMLHLVAVLLFVTSFLKDRRYAQLALVAILGGTLLIKFAGARLFLKPFALFEWYDSNVVMGLGFGMLFLLWAVQWSRGRQMLAALLALIGSQWVASLWPLHANFLDLLSYFRWHYGHLSDLGALVEFVSECWPWVADLCLVLALVERWRLNTAEVEPQ